MKREKLRLPLLLSPNTLGLVNTLPITLSEYLLAVSLREERITGADPLAVERCLIGKRIRHRRALAVRNRLESAIAAIFPTGLLANTELIVIFRVLFDTSERFAVSTSCWFR